MKLPGKAIVIVYRRPPPLCNSCKAKDSCKQSHFPTRSGFRRCFFVWIQILFSLLWRYLLPAITQDVYMHNMTLQHSI